MINLVCFLCSLCIQFAAIDIPTMIIPNFMPADVISSGFDYMSRSGGIWAYYSDVGLSEDGIFITSYDRIDYFEVKYYVPVQPYISTVTSSYSLVNYTTHNNDNFISGGINLNGYSCYVYYYYKQNQSSNFGAQQWHNYNNQSFEFSYPVGFSWPVIAYTTSPLYYDNDLVIVPKDYVVIPDYEGLGSLGSLSSTGHSSEDSPFDTMNSNTISWGSMTGHSSGGSIAPSPHNSSTHFSTTTPSPDSNDSKTDSLLYMLGNKLADITENTGAIGDALGGVLHNQIQGASAIYNAISGLNENIVDFVNYVSEPFDSERFNSAFESSNMGLATSKMRDLHSTIEVNANSIISGLLTTQVNELVIPIDFTDWEFRTEYGTLQPFDQIYYMRFGFLDETRNIWQPLLLGLCYLSFAIFIIFDFPNLLRGSVNAAVS